MASSSTAPKRQQRVLVLGAAGRDYHTFNTAYRDNEAVEVVGFTHAQIPHIQAARYPQQLAGPRYPHGLPIAPQAQLEALIREKEVDTAVLAYSDIPYTEVAALAARVRSAGASLLLPGARDGMLSSTKPVVAVTAVRTGCGKSQVCALVIRAAQAAGKKAVLVRHPMPYGDLAAQAVQRFAGLADLETHKTTIEEREEYEQHIRRGVVVYAGVDYGAILAAAQAEADVVIWDGGNNDTPFFRPDLWLCVADPLRPGHESSHFPGDANFRCADAIIINKADSAPQAGIAAVKAAAAELNPRARVFITASKVSVENPGALRGKRVLCVEDGPTTTHGGMAIGAALVAARACGAEPVDPRPFLRGELAATFASYPHLTHVLPAVGYSEQQIKDLQATIAAVPCDAVLLGTPHDLRRVLAIAQPASTVTYEVADVQGGDEATGATALERYVHDFLTSS